MSHTHTLSIAGVAAPVDWRRIEQEEAFRMTRSLRGVPAPFKNHLYDIRKGRERRLMGTFPEMAEGLVRHGAILPDVLGFNARMERVLFVLRIRHYGLTIEQAQHEETEANSAMDLAQLRFERCQTERNRVDLVIASEAQQRATQQLATALELIRTTR